MGADGNKEVEENPSAPAVMCVLLYGGRVRNHSRRRSTIGLGLRRTPSLATSRTLRLAELRGTSKDEGRR
jgi:hypothetical protein